MVAATGTRRLSVAELQLVLEHVAQAGFDPTALKRTGGRLAGLVWRGQILRGNDRLSPAEAHYLRHVVRRHEWPPGTTLQEYLDSIRNVVLDPTSGVLTNRYQGAWQLTIVRRSGGLEGPAGLAWIMVDYRVAMGHWMTAFQPDNGLGVLRRPERTDLRWLRHPT